MQVFYDYDNDLDKLQPVYSFSIATFVGRYVYLELPYYTDWIDNS